MMKSTSTFTFGDKMQVAMHILIHVTGRTHGEHVFGNIQIAPGNDFFSFSGSRFSNAILTCRSGTLNETPLSYFVFLSFYSRVGNRSRSYWFPTKMTQLIFLTCLHETH